jgi:hypothetical protein
MPLDPKRIPAELIPLLPLAEKWGTGDDLVRSERVDTASIEEVRELIKAVTSPDYPLFEWLSGPESYSAHPSEEYIAFCNLSDAYDQAKSLQEAGYYSKPQRHDE